MSVRRVAKSLRPASCLRFCPLHGELVAGRYCAVGNRCAPASALFSRRYLRRRRRRQKLGSARPHRRRRTLGRSVPALFLSKPRRRRRRLLQTRSFTVSQSLTADSALGLLLTAEPDRSGGVKRRRNRRRRPVGFGRGLSSFVRSHFDARRSAANLHTDELKLIAPHRTAGAPFAVFSSSRYGLLCPSPPASPLPSFSRARNHRTTQTQGFPTSPGLPVATLSFLLQLLLDCASSWDRHKPFKSSLKKSPKGITEPLRINYKNHKRNKNAF